MNIKLKNYRQIVYILIIRFLSRIIPQTNTIVSPITNFSNTVKKMVALSFFRIQLCSFQQIGIQVTLTVLGTYIFFFCKHFLNHFSSGGNFLVEICFHFTSQLYICFKAKGLSREYQQNSKNERFINYLESINSKNLKQIFIEKQIYIISD